MFISKDKIEKIEENQRKIQRELHELAEAIGFERIEYAELYKRDSHIDRILGRSGTEAVKNEKWQKIKKTINCLVDKEVSNLPSSLGQFRRDIVSLCARVLKVEQTQKAEESQKLTKEIKTKK